MSEQNKQLDEEERELLKYANETPAVQSLLYDIGMLPEQLSAQAGEWEKRRTPNWYRMLIIISAMRQAAKRE